MLRSLVLKLAMLAVTGGLVLWMEWGHQPSPQPLGLSMQERATHVANRSNPQSDQHSGRQASVKVVQLQERVLVDLNRASAQELEALPGIGAALAQRVIAFRTSAGRFHTVEDLRGVKGIGAKKFERLKSLVTVSTGETQPETERSVS